MIIEGFNNPGRVPWNKGLTKDTNSSIASMASKLSRKKSDLELELDDDGKLQRKWINKRVNAKAEGIEFNLTFEEFMQLVSDAGLKSSQLGFTGEGYVLARIGDDGPYSINNCRFITQAENAKEKKISEKSKEASRRNIKICHERNKNNPNHGKLISEGLRNSDYYKKRVEQARINKELRESALDKRYCGEHNSQIGTFWITNGIINKKWKDTKGEVPEGFYRGRKM